MPLGGPRENQCLVFTKMHILLDDSEDGQ